MSISFSRSTRSLRTDKFQTSTLSLLLTLLLLLLWGGWFFGAKLTLYEVADRSEVVGSTEVVAYFPATALGRVWPGQAARLRLSAFPWMQYGTVPAIVTSVTHKTNDGWVQVQLTLNPAANPKIPLQRGMPAQAEIKVEQVSPSTLVLRSLGYWAAAANPETQP